MKMDIEVWHRISDILQLLFKRINKESTSYIWLDYDWNRAVRICNICYDEFDLNAGDLIEQHALDHLKEYNLINLL